MKDRIEENIEHSWAVCYIYPDRPSSIGYVIKQENGVLEIRDSETTHHKPTHWNDKKVERYSTIQQAIERFVEIRPDLAEKTLENIARDFPSQFRQTTKPEYRDLVAQSQPKCIRDMSPLELESAIQSGEIDVGYGGELIETHIKGDGHVNPYKRT